MPSAPLRLLACLLPLLLAVPTALGQGQFRDLVTFGDSLTHNNILWLVYGTERALYGDDPLEALFDKAQSPGDDIGNYALAGSETGAIGFQIFTYDTTRFFFLQDKATMIGFEFGGNDLLGREFLLANNPPGTDVTADGVINEAIANIREGLTDLVDEHPNAQFIIWTVPDITYTPELWQDFSPTQEANIRAHTERINLRLRSLDSRANVVVVDVYAFLREAIDMPPVIKGVELVGPPLTGDYHYLFADEIHPTAVSNALLANEMIELVNVKFGDTIPFYTEEELADLARIDY